MAAPDGIYITLADLQGRVSAAVMLRIFNDGATGAFTGTENTYIQSFILDGESDVLAYVGAAYGGGDIDALVALGVSVSRRLKTLMLDAIEVRIGRRWPEYVRGNWDQRRKELDADLERLRMRVTNLATSGVPESAANEGGIMRSGDPDNTEPRTPMFRDGLGDFSS